jgi:hypothetical protein
VADPPCWWHDREGCRVGPSPAQERIAIAITFERELSVALERTRLAEHVDVDAVTVTNSTRTGGLIRCGSRASTSIAFPHAQDRRSPART